MTARGCAFSEYIAKAPVQNFLLEAHLKLAVSPEILETT
jgi:hypothetical protein